MRVSLQLYIHWTKVMDKTGLEWRENMVGEFFFNYNNITRKLIDTHQARNHRPDYYYYYYHYSVFRFDNLRNMWQFRWKTIPMVLINNQVFMLPLFSSTDKEQRGTAIIVIIIIIIISNCMYIKFNTINTVKLPKLSWHSGYSRGSVCVCVYTYLCLCVLKLQ